MSGMCAVMQEHVLTLICGFLHDEVYLIYGRVGVEVMRKWESKYQRVGKTCDIPKIAHPFRKAFRCYDEKGILWLLSGKK